MKLNLFSTLRSDLNFSAFNKYKVMILAIFLFILYFSNFTFVMSGDTVPATILPWALLGYQKVVLDDFTGFIITQWSAVTSAPHDLAEPLPYFVTMKQGHLVSTSPIVTPLFATPFYLPAYILSLLGIVPIDFSYSFIWATVLSSKFAAVSIAVLSVVLLYFLLKRIFDEKWAFILSLVYGACTSTWTTSSQMLWQHGTAGLLIIGCYYLLFRNIDQRKNIYLLGIGALSALVIFNRPPDVILLLPVLYYCLKERYWQVLPSFILVGLPFLAYNVYYFNSILGPYYSAANPNLYSVTTGVVTPSQGGFDLSGYIWRIVKQFVDFIVLLLTYTPIAILAIPGIINVLKQKDIKGLYRQIHLIFIATLLLYVIFYGSFNLSSGWGYGPRYWTDALPLIIIFIGWSRSNSNLYNAIFICLAVASFALQAYGAYVFLRGPMAQLDWLVA